VSGTQIIGQLSSSQGGGKEEKKEERERSYNPWPALADALSGEKGGKGPDDNKALTN